MDELYGTRPGTPMIGPYSVNQMDDFYAALAVGEAKPTGIMNYLQRLYVAERCAEGSSVLDVCCGRGLQLPVLYRYAPHLERYVGLDVSAANLAEARHRVETLDGHYGGRPFHIELVDHDVARPWPPIGVFDVVVYTSALEHLPRDLGAASLRHAADALAAGGRLYLSTPNTAGPPPRRLQHRVHVYEWEADELVGVLAHVGLAVEDTIGILPGSPKEIAAALGARFGPGAELWYERLRQTVAHQFLDAVSAAAVAEVATEVLFVCARTGEVGG